MSMLIFVTDKPAFFFFFGPLNLVTQMRKKKKKQRRNRKPTVTDMLMHRIASEHVHFTTGLISFSLLVVSFHQNQTHRSIWPTLCNGFSLCHFHFVFIDSFFSPVSLLIMIMHCFCFIFAASIIHLPNKYAQA